MNKHSRLTGNTLIIAPILAQFNWSNWTGSDAVTKHACLQFFSWLGLSCMHDYMCHCLLSIRLNSIYYYTQLVTEPTEIKVNEWIAVFFVNRPLPGLIFVGWWLVGFSYSEMALTTTESNRMGVVTGTLFSTCTHKTLDRQRVAEMISNW